MEDSGAEKRNDPSPEAGQGLSNSRAASDGDLKGVEEALSRIERALAGGAVKLAHERWSLHFTAVNLLDRLGRYDQAFAQAQLAHQARGVRYDPCVVERLVDEKIERFTRQTIRCLPRASESSDKPVFILGMPQSGMSLVEQVLASHPLVHGAGELNWIAQIQYSILQRIPLTERGQTLDLRRCSLATINELASQYLRPLNALNPQAQRITDRMPLNFLNMGLIAVLFPDARVIHCVRDPLDTCLSCYLTELSVGNEFSADLTNLGHFYRQYRRLMEHWKQVLDYSMLDVSYEAMVENPQSQAQLMVEFLGLPWDRDVANSISELSSRSLFCSSIGLWNHYANHLEPLRFALKESAPPSFAGAP
jgi:hypothetical protein